MHNTPGVTASCQRLTEFSTFAHSNISSKTRGGCYSQFSARLTPIHNQNSVWIIVIHPIRIISAGRMYSVYIHLCLEEEARGFWVDGRHGISWGVDGIRGAHQGGHEAWGEQLFLWRLRNRFFVLHYAQRWTIEILLQKKNDLHKHSG